MAGQSTAGSSSLPIWELVEESLDEAEFLWRRWGGMLSTHVYGLDGVAFWVEERLLGAIDGLHVGGEAALDRLLGHVFTCRPPHPGFAWYVSAETSAPRRPSSRRRAKGKAA